MPNQLNIFPIPLITFLNALLRLFHKSEKRSAIEEPKSESHFPTFSKNLPMLLTKLDKPSVKFFQKSEKKLPTIVASSLILSGIELTAPQISSSKPEELSPLS